MSRAGGNVSLPVIGGGAPRPSRRAKWRALSLALVHVVFAVHILHWWWAGETLSPVEPSESMETLETGRVNAGIIFFALSILATLILGRWFCGWGCHFIAYQDACTWVLKKMGIRPQPLRARLLLFVPLVIALYMFVWPTVHRWLVGGRLPGWSNNLTTKSFWETFPGPVIAILTIVIAGFCIVYFLGSKGFCTYACPYGAFYGLADRLAPGRIRVNERCDHSGHCTQVCTSNVDVAREVALYGMVVDPGCMKCGDCVSVCPNGALYFGFGVPEILKNRRLRTVRPPKPRPAPLAWWEELLLIGVFALSFFCWRGVYEAVPLLMTVGMSCILASLVLLAVRMAVRHEVRLQNLVLRREGRMTRSGRLVMAGIAAAVLLTLHSGAIKYRAARGEALFEQSVRFGQRPWYPGFDPERHLTAEQRRLRDRAWAHLRWCERWGLADWPALHVQMAWLALLYDDAAAAERHLRRAMAEVHEPAATLHFRLGRVLRRQGRLDEAIEEYRRALALEPHRQNIWWELGDALMQAGREGEAIAHQRAELERFPEDPVAHYRLGRLLAARGELQAGIEHLEAAVRAKPDYTLASLALADALLRAGREAEARACLTAALGYAPSDGRLREALRRLGAGEPARRR